MKIIQNVKVTWSTITKIRTTNFVHALLNIKGKIKGLKRKCNRNPCQEKPLYKKKLRCQKERKSMKKIDEHMDNNLQINDHLKANTKIAIHQKKEKLKLQLNNENEHLAKTMKTSQHLSMRKKNIRKSLTRIVQTKLPRSFKMCNLIQAAFKENDLKRNLGTKLILILQKMKTTRNVPIHKP